MSDGPTVLVVDDEVDLLFTISLSLELAGYRVVKASSGEEALEVAAATPPDAIVLDLRLPGIDGWEVIRRLGEAGRRAFLAGLSFEGEAAKLTSLYAELLEIP